MNLYGEVGRSYRLLSRKPTPVDWGIDLPTLEEVVAAVRDERSPSAADDVMRRLAIAARTDRRAGVVALHALAPRLQRSLGRARSAEYRNDALSELAVVLLTSPLEVDQLAVKLVNRAHTRVRWAAHHVYYRGFLNHISVVPADPTRLHHGDVHVDDHSEAVADRLDLCAFHASISDGIDDGFLPEEWWTDLRDHRLRREIVPFTETSTVPERKRSERARVRLRPFIHRYLQAA